MPNSKGKKRPPGQVKATRKHKKKPGYTRVDAAGEDTINGSERTQEEKYRMLVQNIPCAVYSAYPGKAGPTTFMSNKWKGWTGYSPEELYSDTEAWPRCIHPDDREHAVNTYIQACRDRTAYNLEYRIIHKDTGQLRYVRDQGHLLKDDKGAVVRVDGIVTDITELKKENNELDKYKDSLEELVSKRTAELTSAYETLKVENKERKRAEQALHYVEREQLTVLENLSDLIVYRDRDMVTRWASKSMAKWHGMSQDEIVGRLCYKARYGRDEPCENCHIVEAMKSGQRQELEKKFPDERFWHVTVNPVFNDSGRVIGTIEVSQDITDRKKADQALRQSEEKYRKLFEGAQDGIVLAEAETGIIVDCNRAIAEMLEKEKSELVGRHQGILHPPHRIDDGFSVSFREHQQKRETPVTEEQVITSTGRIRDVVIKAKHVQLGDRKLLQGVFHDITERKKAADELKKSKDILEKTFTSLDSALFILDAKDPPEIIDCNPAATIIFGYEKQEMLGRTTEFLHVSRESLHEFQQALHRSNEDQGGMSFFEYKMQRSDGEVFDSEHSVRLLKDDKGLIIGWISVVRDITERKQSEKALRETTDLLETIFGHTNMLLAYLDPQFNFVRVNRAYADADQREPSFFHGKNHFVLYPNEENEAIFRRVAETGIPYFAYSRPFEYAGHPERGISYWDWGLVPIKNQQGIVSGLVLTLVDVTDRENAEEALKASEGKLNAMLQSISDFMSMMDKDLNILWANDVVKRRFGDDVIGKKCYEVFHGRQNSCQPQPCLTLRVFEDGQVHEHDTEVTDKDGNTMCFHCVANVALRDKNGKATAVLELSKDITDRKLAEEALREERDMAQKYLDVAGVMFLVIDINQKVKLINQKGCEILGFDESDIIGRDWIEDFVPERVRDDVSLVGDKLAAGDTEAFENFENPVLTRSGEERIITWHNAVLRDNDGNVVATLCSGADITDRKMTEQALKESEKTLRSIFRAAPIGIGLVSDRVILQVNDKICDMLGYSRDELLGKSSRILYLSDKDYERIGREKYKQIREGGIGTVETRLKRKDGRDIDIILNSSVLDPTDLSKGVTFTALDITERKKSEQALRESEERLKILFESAPDAIYLIDSEGKFIDGNRAAEELIGFAKEEVIGKNLAEIGLLPGGQLSKAKANLKNVAVGELSGPNEYIVKRKNGIHISIEVRTFPVKIGGKMLSLGIARDITDRKQTEKKLLEHQAKLKSLASQLSLTEELERHRLATDLHDQISQSLVISKIKLDQLRKSSTSDEIKRPLDDICKCLGQIIDDTRTLTFDLSYPILYELGFEAAVAEWLTDHIQEKHGIRTEFVSDGHQKVLEDDIRVLLFRNVRELLINVVKHAQASKVKVSIRKVKDNIRVSVEDDGLGFDPVEVTSMASKKAEFGLFSIRERLEQLGGLIEIDSVPGRGSKITMTVPLKSEVQADRI